ncbi:MAG: isoprenyl transferase [Alphaproteobacteria bacterium]|nr:isoprenyl transferase [Alphaproteobacteria bacterium]
MVAVEQSEHEARIPNHVAVIMDGNGRWAKLRGLPRAAGHQAGAEAVRRTLKACIDLGIGHLTIFAFSSENWRRPEQEVDDLMGLLRFYLKKEISHLKGRGIRLGFIGDRTGLAPDILEIMSHAEQQTAKGDRLCVTVALNYGARDEIVRAMRSLGQDIAQGRISPDAIDEALITARLDTKNIPDPDLIIRTSGEQRLSNFLAWQGAYAELVFAPVLWPDFGRADLDAALDEYQKRDRRYGEVAVS